MGFYPYVNIKHKFYFFIDFFVILLVLLRILGLALIFSLVRRQNYFIWV